MALAVFLVAIFFVTGADAASIVMGMLSQNGKEEPFRWLVIFWGVATGAVAAVLLWAGGLSALQTLVIIVAGPFMLILIGMCVSLMKELRKERFESTLPAPGAARGRARPEVSRRPLTGPHRPGRGVPCPSLLTGTGYPAHTDVVPHSAMGCVIRNKE